jgi:murein DD-endopeptidase MepM/ murein hydrolase activator NlpD
MLRMRRKRPTGKAFQAIATSLALLLPTIAAAAPPQLALPLVCTPNQDCWISNHVDLDPGPGARDYRCGSLTYDTHSGTDFAIRDVAAMREGVSVVAAAAGQVSRVRDGVADISVRIAGRASVSGAECGNGVVITHEDGWETQYCHMRHGSLRVKAGEQIVAGQALGLVGMSGLTEYPHLHLTVRHAGRTIDPFRGEGEGAACALAAPLWRAETAAQLPYAPGVVYNAGFSSEPPDEAAVRAGAYRKTGPLRADAAVLGIYAEVFAVLPGDVLELRIVAPDGSSLTTQRFEVTQRQARRFAYVGLRRPAGGWHPGEYRGEVNLIRAAGGVSPASRLEFWNTIAE